MTSRTLETESPITTTTTTSESSVSIVELTGTRKLLPSPPHLKTESASWHSQWLTSRTTPLTASANSAPAMLSGRSHFGTGSYQVYVPVDVNLLDQYVQEIDAASIGSTTPHATADYDYDYDTPMPFTMDNNNDDDQYEDYVLFGHNYEPASPPISPSHLFPPI